MRDIRLGLQSRVNWGLAAVLGISFAALGWFLVSMQWRFLMDDLARRGEQQALSVAVASADHIGRGSFYLLEGLVAKVEYSPQVAFCRILDNQAKDLVLRRQELSVAEKDVLVVSRPIEAGDKGLGEVRVGMRLDGVRKELETTMIRMCSAFVAVLVFVCAVNHFFLNSTLVKPIQTLVRMARNVGGQDFVRTDLARRRDELGELAAEFNAMSENLGTVYERLEHTVTERTAKLHAALREVEVIFDNSLVGIVVFGAEGRILRCNKRFAEMFGYEQEVLLRMSMADLHYSRKSCRELSLRHDLAVAGTGFMQMDYQFLRQDGARIWCQVSSKAIDPQDASKGVIWVFEDITERRRASDSLHAQADDLRRAKEAADRATLAKSEFVARMSHEIRTPMNAILGMAQVLAETRLDEEQREYVRTFADAGEMLLSIINDILDFSKIEEGHIEIEHVPFDIIGLTETVVRLMENPAKAKHITLQTRIGAGIAGGYLGDPVRIRQILVNLVGNAIKFTASGFVHLEVDLVRDSAGHRLAVSVQDSGVGIAPEKIETIFESFAQADASITRSFGGTGLGLAISRRLARLMGGDITVQSTLGQGARFTLVLPLEVHDVGHGADMMTTGQIAEPAGVDVAPAPAQSQTSADLARNKDAQPTRLLVVDDIDANRRVIELFLRNQQVDVSFATDGREAVELTVQQRFDLILMDMEMPVLDGMSAVREIRAREQESGQSPVHIVAMTAHSFAEQKEHILGAGCSSYLAKPIRKDSLIGLLTAFRSGNVRNDLEAA